MMSVRCVEGASNNPIYTITFDANGGTVSPTSATTRTDRRLAALPTPTREGYTFDGWYTAQTGGTTVTTYTVFSANGAIFARWTEVPITPPSGSTFPDSRDGKTYKKVVIGTQTWMAENLNYDASGSVCYDNDPANCTKYGRLYNWATALTACPSGYHLPSDAEWTTLTDFVGGSSTAGTALKSTSGWNSYVNGTDEYGFSALPGGGNFWVDDGFRSFEFADRMGFWWSATEYDARYDWSSQSYVYQGVYRGMYNEEERAAWGVRDQIDLLSVRCVQN
jgi:uncharacterized protein (TIGR02145 family)/uncharacterized repeat protein (TIGR02543 family)